MTSKHPMSVGWCAGRPGDHELANEAQVAELFMNTYPGTSCVRDFRGSEIPAANWWTTQTCAAVNETYEVLEIGKHQEERWDSGKCIIPAAPPWMGGAPRVRRREPPETSERAAPRRWRAHGR